MNQNLITPSLLHHKGEVTISVGHLTIVDRIKAISAIANEMAIFSIVDQSTRQFGDSIKMAGMSPLFAEVGPNQAIPNYTAILHHNEETDTFELIKFMWVGSGPLSHNNFKPGQYAILTEPIFDDVVNPPVIVGPVLVKIAEVVPQEFDGVYIEVAGKCPKPYQEMVPAIAVLSDRKGERFRVPPSCLAQLG